MPLDLAVVDDLRHVVRHRAERLGGGLTHVVGVRHEADKPLERRAVLGVHVLRVGAGVRRELLLVEGLERAVDGVGRHAEPLARELLGAGGVEERRRALAAPFALDRRDVAGFPLCLGQHVLGRSLRAARRACDEEPLAEVEPYPVRVLPLERLDRAVAFHDEREGRRPDAPHALRRAHGGGVEPARVHAHEPVGLRPRDRRTVEPRVLGVGLHAPERLLEGGVLERRAPQAVDGQAAPHEVEREVGDALALAVGVARVDDAPVAPAAHQLRDGVELGVRAALLRHLPAPPVRCGNDGEGRRAFGAPLLVLGVLVGHEEAQEVALRPGDVEPVALDPRAPVAPAPEERRERLADAALLGDDERLGCGLNHRGVHGHRFLRESRNGRASAHGERTRRAYRVGARARSPAVM